MKHRKNLLIGATFLTTLGVLGVGQHKLEQTAAAQTRGQIMAPKFEVDPTIRGQVELVGERLRAVPEDLDGHLGGLPGLGGGSGVGLGAGQFRSFGDTRADRGVSGRFDPGRHRLTAGSVIGPRAAVNNTLLAG